MRRTQLGLLFFVTGALLFLIFDVYGHLSCESEQQAVDDAEAADTRTNSEVQAAWLKVRAQEIHMGLSSTDTADSKKDQDRLEELQNALEVAVKQRDNTEKKLADARKALNNCIEKDRRSCPGNCSKAHTQDVTSCECNCSYSLPPSLTGCDCGDCSRYINYN